MLFPPSLITSSYGLALFSCPPVSKPLCQAVFFEGISQLEALLNVFPGRPVLYTFLWKEK